MNADIIKFRELIIRECKDKHLLDPRESDIRGSYHVEITFTVDEIRSFLIATAEKVEDGFPTFPCDACGEVGPWLKRGQFDHLCPNCGGMKIIENNS